MGINDKLFVWLFVGTIFTAYLFSVYSKPFSTATAYIFHPETQSLYSVELAPDIGGNKKWEFFYASPEYVQVINTQYEGTSDQLRESKKDANTYRQWLTQQAKTLQFFHAYFWPNKQKSNTSAFEALPEDWKLIRKQRDFDIKSVRWVDAAIVSHGLEGPLQTRVLKDAILLEQSSAYLLAEFLFGYVH